MRRIAFEDLGHAAEAGVAQVVREWPQELQRRGAIVVDAVVRLDVRADQPGPDWTLVVPAIAAAGIAAVVAAVRGIVGAKRAQAIRREQ